MNECWKGSVGSQKRRKSLWFEDREEFMEEALSLASKDWIQIEKREVGKGDGSFRYEEKGK